MKNKYTGLNDIEVKQNQKIYGLNEFEKQKHENFLVIFIKEFNDWLVIILILAALISLIVDPSSLFEAFVILLILFINASIGAVQEVKARNTLEGLKQLSNHKVTVIRNNNIMSIEPKYLTIDDIVILTKGIMIDADMLVLEGNNLALDESILTGESISVNKNINDKVYSGTYITSGNGIGKVINIGMKSKMGEIASSILNTKEELTPLEIKLAQIGKIIGLISILICLVIFVIELMLKISLIEAFKSAVSLAVAAIPEGLATVVTVCLAIGVNKMAKENAIVKKLASVETLGCSNIVCTDKTGTLTENKQKVIMIYENKIYKMDELNNISTILSNYLYISSNFDEIDPIDNAILLFLNENNFIPPKYELLNVKPFDSNNKYMSVEFKFENVRNLVFKGAFDILCNLVLKKPDNEFYNVANMMMEKGYRVIAVATEIEIIALIAMQDLPRKDVIKTIALANSAGVRTIMITGDHAKTAYSIASQLNIAKGINEVLTKEELDKLSDEELTQNIEKYSVFARVNPLDKVRIINAWKSQNMIVAMTGDGINDAPALKIADIGCAMGSGAEISKDCADIILVDSNYNTIIKAIKNGRSIYENIKRCCKYLLSSNIGEVFTIFFITLISLIININLGIPLLAIHLLWINIITDSLPAFGLGTLNPTDELMKKKPRKKDESFFDKQITVEIVFMGVIIGFLTVISYLIGLRINSIYAQTMAFFTLSTSQLFHAYNCSTDKSIFRKEVFKNKFLNLSFLIGIILQFAVIYISSLNILFKLQQLPLGLMSIALLLAINIVIFSEIRKVLQAKKKTI